MESELFRSRKLFEVLVRENEGPVMLLINALVRDSALAEDMFQETMIVAWQKFDEYDTSRPLAPWLRGIAVNLIRNAQRKRKNDCIFVGDDVANYFQDVIQQVESQEGDSWRDKVGALSECIQQLAPRARMLIKERYEKGQNASEIAVSQSMAATTVRKQLERIRSQLGKCIMRRLAGVSGA